MEEKNEEQIFLGGNVGKTHCRCFALLLWYAGVKESGNNQDSAW